MFYSLKSSWSFTKLIMWFPMDSNLSFVSVLSPLISKFIFSRTSVSIPTTSVVSSFDIFLFTSVSAKNGIGVSPFCWYSILNSLNWVFKNALTAFISRELSRFAIFQSSVRNPSIYYTSILRLTQIKFSFYYIHFYSFCFFITIKIPLVLLRNPSLDIF